MLVRKNSWKGVRLCKDHGKNQVMSSNLFAV